MKATLLGPHLTVRRNGVLIQDLDLGQQNQPVRGHDGRPAPPVKDQPRRDHTGFQELSRGGDRVEIRNARIKVLDQP